jgi:ureidoglycolate lyase
VVFVKKVKVQQLSLEAFKKYGYYANMIDPDGEYFGKDPSRFYPDMVPFNSSSKNIGLSVCKISKREKIIDAMEYHTNTPEGIMPLDADVLMQVAPVSPDGEVPLDKIEVFYIPKGTMVVIRPGVWHHSVFVKDSESVNVLIVLPERTYANDCIVVDLKSEEYVQILD